MINEHILKLYGSHPLESPLDPSCYAKITAEIQIDSVEKKDLHDGTFDMIYKAKAISAVDTEQLGKVIRGKPPSQSESKKLRASIYVLGQDEGVADSEAFYQWFMDRLRGDLRSVYQLLKSKL